VLVLTILAISVDPAEGIDPNATVTQLFYNESGEPLYAVASVVPMASVLGGFGATADANDPELPTFLEGAFDVGDEELRDGDEIVVGDTSVVSTTDENGNLVEETLIVTGLLASESIVLELTTESDGMLSLDLTIFDQQGTATEYEFPLQVFQEPSSEIYIAAMLGTCNCSKKGVTGCTDSMCQDGDTCPNNNGESCGFYTRTVIEAVAQAIGEGDPE